MPEFLKGQEGQEDVVTDRWVNGDPKVVTTSEGFELHYTPSYDGAPYTPPLFREEALEALEKRRYADSLANAKRLCDMDDHKGSLFLY